MQATELCLKKKEKLCSHRAFVHIFVISFFIVEVNKGDPQEDTEQYDGVKCCKDRKNIEIQE